MPIVCPSCSVSETPLTAISSNAAPLKKPPPMWNVTLMLPASRSGGASSGMEPFVPCGSAARSSFVYSCCGLGEYFSDRPVLHDLARSHDIDAIGEAPDDAEVVGDEDHRHAEARLQALQERQDLRLDGDVERGRRLVGDQDVGIVGERHRDHHALPLAAGKLVRIGIDAALGLLDLHQPQQLDRALARRRLAQPRMFHQRLGDLIADRIERIERGHRLLKDHGDLGAADAIQLALAESEQIRAAIVGRAGRAAVRGKQPHRRHDGLALARP